MERDVAVPMRDGVALRADVYRPDGADPVPAVVSRTPYDRSFNLTPPAGLDPETAAEAGFAVVIQDVRGQHGSDGDFYPFRHEGPDGHDTVEWIAAQPWCTGAVGMAGRSYTAATQWLAAAQQPPHLRAIAPMVVGSNYYDGWVYQGGAFQLGFNLFWVHLMTAPKGRSSLDAHFKHLPLPEVPLLEESAAGRFYRDWLSHPTYDDYWRALSIDRSYGQVEVPVLNVGGWYDLFLGGTLENFRRMREEGGSETSRAGTRLLVGPWAHGSTYGQYPDHSFKPFAPDDRVDLAEMQLGFFARHLKDGDGRRRRQAAADLRDGREQLARRGRLAARTGLGRALVPPQRGRRRRRRRHPVDEPARERARGRLRRTTPRTPPPRSAGRPPSRRASCAPTPARSTSRRSRSGRTCWSTTRLRSSARSR